jgi:pimeloyl-ACP methyl ester carboxylesterase
MDKSVIFSGKEIFFSETGSGFPVVLLHGFLESSGIWEDFSVELTTSFRVICPDLPGFGKTPVIAEIHTMELLARSVKTILDSLGIEKCIMVGHSMGGYITLEFARLFPETLNGFVLFHSQAMADSEEAKENRRRTINIVKLNREGFIRHFIPDLFSPANIDKFSAEIENLRKLAAETSQEGIIAALEGMKNRHSNIEFLTVTHLPVLFIAGKHDSRIPVQNVMAQALLPSHSEVLILGNTGHMGYIEARNETLGIIRSFCERFR